MLGVGHQHSGALNLSVYHNDEYVCSSYPRYGTTVGKAGDEKGHLVEMTLCLEFDGTSGPYPVGGKERLSFSFGVGITRQVSDCYLKVLEKRTATNDVFFSSRVCPSARTATHRCTSRKGTGYASMDGIQSP